MSGVRCGRSKKHWLKKERQYDFFDVKLDLEAVLKCCKISPNSYVLNDDVPNYYHPGKAGSINFLDKSKDAFFGEIHPDIAKKIFNSCIKFPEITGGTNSVNCILTKLSKGRIFFKNGAEGVFVALIPEKKSALAVKIIDGATRAAEVAIAGLISDLKIIDENELKKVIEKPIYNSANQDVGIMNYLL